MKIQGLFVELDDAGIKSFLALHSLVRKLRLRNSLLSRTTPALRQEVLNAEMEILDIFLINDPVEFRMSAGR